MAFFTGASATFVRALSGAGVLVAFDVIVDSSGHYLDTLKTKHDSGKLYK